MSPPTIVAPAAASIRADAFPIPLATPVSTATWPDKSNSSCTRVTSTPSIVPAKTRGSLRNRPWTLSMRAREPGYAGRAADRPQCARGLGSCGRGKVTAILALGARFSDVNVLAYLAAFGGGVVSFLSPCVLPLLPGYLSMVTGLDLTELQDQPRVARAPDRHHDRGVRRRVQRGVRRAGACPRRVSGSCCTIIKVCSRACRAR